MSVKYITALRDGKLVLYCENSMVIFSIFAYSSNGYIQHVLRFDRLQGYIQHVLRFDRLTVIFNTC